MLDLLDHPEALKRSNLQIQQLGLHGVPYGCAASDFPIHLVSQVTLAPIVKSSAWSSGHGATYQDENGQALSLSEVIANVLQFGGVLHFQKQVSFRFENGRVSGFAVYGSQLTFFQYIRNYEQFCKEFGEPDVVSTNEAYGDLMGYKHYYASCEKVVEWDDWGKKVALVNFGMPRP